MSGSGTGGSVDEERQALLPLFTPSILDSIPIYSVVLDTYDLVVSRVDTSLKYEQLKSPQIHSFLIRPLVAALREDLSAGTLYALMANMLQFNKESTTNVSMSSVMATRGMICEIVAIKLLKEYSDPDDLMNALTYDFYPLANGNTGKEIIPRWQRISTLELSIKAEAKRFLSHPVVVEVLEEIWNGSVMFQSSMHKLHRVKFANEEEVIAHGYGRRGPGVRYHYENASLFKLSRLRVPRYRHFINLGSFAILLTLYVMVLARQPGKFSSIELVFWLWSLGFILDEIVGFSDAGFTLYVMSLWNWFDLIILILLVSYAGCLFASYISEAHSGYLSHIAHDLLASISIFLFPRLFSVLDNYEVFSQMVVSVKRMMVDLAVACLVMIIFSSGFWVAFTMAFARDVFSANKIAYDLLKILFGFTPTVWDSWSYYSVLGRTMLVFYLFITHFLIMTILIAVLTNSFSAVTTNAHEEHQYLFAVNTITMIKSESSSLFSYTAPLNLLEWVVRPLYYTMPLRNFLVLNRTIIKITHFPVLFLIFLYEKFHLRMTRRKELQQENTETERKKVLKQALNHPTLPHLQSSHGRTNTQTSNEEEQQRRPGAHDRSSGSTTANGGGGKNKSTRNRLKRTNTDRTVTKRKTNNNKVAPPSSSKPKVSNDDLLDEVFKRPYKGTIRVRPSIRLDDEDNNNDPNNNSSTRDYNYDSFSHDPNVISRTFNSEAFSDPEESLSQYRRRPFDEWNHDADSENSDGPDVDDDILGPGLSPRIGTGFNRVPSNTDELSPLKKKKRKSNKRYMDNNSLSPVDRYWDDSSQTTARRIIKPSANRERLFSTTSSLVRHGTGNIAVSPTRSTASVLDKHLWKMQQQMKGIYSYRNRSASSGRPRLNRRHTAQVNPENGEENLINDDDEDDDDKETEDEYIEEEEEEEGEEEDAEDDDHDDNESVVLTKFGQSGHVTEEIQGMSRLIMRRMDTLENGFKNMELLLSRLPELNGTAVATANNVSGAGPSTTQSERMRPYRNRTQGNSGSNFNGNNNNGEDI